MISLYELHQENKDLYFKIKAVIDKNPDFFKTLRKFLEVSEERIEFVKLALSSQDAVIKDPCELNDILRCIFEKMKSNSSNDFVLKETNICSQGDLLEYDPKKNGQNILKHGLSFHGVVSYSGDCFGRLIAHVKFKEEMRLAIFSKYFLDDSNGLYLKNSVEYKDFKYLCVVSICTQRNDKFRFISSRTIDPFKKLDKQLQTIIKDENLDNESLDDLRKRAKEILDDYYKDHVKGS